MNVVEYVWQLSKQVEVWLRIQCFDWKCFDASQEEILTVNWTVFLSYVSDKIRRSWMEVQDFFAFASAQNQNIRMWKTHINCKGGHSKAVRCTSCNRAMLIKNCSMDINTTFQLEKDNKQYTVIAHSRVLDSYKNDQDSIIEKVLLLM